MRRVFDIQTDITFGANETVVEVVPALSAPLALEVSMLMHGLASPLLLISPAKTELALLCNSDPAVRHATVERIPHGLRFCLGQNQAGYLLSTLLQTVRDGAADVNHIHLDGHFEDRAYDLTVFFEISKPPLPWEEAARLLGKRP